MGMKLIVPESEMNGMKLIVPESEMKGVRQVQPDALEQPVAAQPRHAAQPQSDQNVFVRMGGAFMQRLGDLTAEQKLALTTFGSDPAGRAEAMAEYKARRTGGVNYVTGNIVSKNVVGAAGMLPDMIEGAAGRLAGSAAGKIVTAPLALIPRVGPAVSKTISPISSKLASALGAAAPMYLSGVGQLYSDMDDEGVPDEMAMRAAKLGAIPYAAIESINVYLPVGKAMKGGAREVQGMVKDAMLTAIRKAIAKRGGNEALKRGIAAGMVEIGVSTLAESSEEFWQEISNETTKNIAKALSGMNPKWGDAFGKAVDAFTQAIGPTLVLGGLGGSKAGRKEAALAAKQTDAPLESGYGIPPEVVAQGQAAVDQWLEARQAQLATQPVAGQRLPPLIPPEVEAAAAAQAAQPAQEVVTNGVQGQEEGQGPVAKPVETQIEGAAAPSEAAVQSTQPEIIPPAPPQSAEPVSAPGPRVSPEVQSEVDQFQNRARRMAGLEDVEFRAVERPDTPMHGAVQKYADETGRTIVWVESPNRPDFEFQATPGAAKGTIILNANSTTLGRDIIEHEVGHQFADDNPGFVKRVVETIKATNAKAWETFQKRAQGDSIYSQQSPETQEREFFAHAFGTVMNDRAFLDRLAREDMTTFQKLVQFVKDVVDRLRGVASPTGAIDKTDPRALLKASDFADIQSVYDTMVEVAKAVKAGGVVSGKEGTIADKGVKFAKPVTPEQDAEYAKAVEAGDNETAQMMVDEAAKKAGYRVVYHGTDADSITTFKPREGRFGKAVYTATSETRAKEYGRNTMRLYASGDASVYGPDADAIVYSGRPENFKSADPITRDYTGRIIPLSERFNPKSPDIRFAKPADRKRDERVRIIDEIETINVSSKGGESNGLFRLRETIVEQMKSATPAEKRVLQEYKDRLSLTQGIGGDQAAERATSKWGQQFISEADPDALAAALEAEMESQLADARGEGAATQDEREEIYLGMQSIAEFMDKNPDSAVPDSLMSGSTDAVRAALAKFRDEEVARRTPAEATDDEDRNAMEAEAATTTARGREYGVRKSVVRLMSDSGVDVPFEKKRIYTQLSNVEGVKRGQDYIDAEHGGDIEKAYYAATGATDERVHPVIKTVVTATYMRVLDIAAETARKNGKVAEAAALDTERSAVQDRADERALATGQGIQIWREMYAKWFETGGGIAAQFTHQSNKANSEQYPHMDEMVDASEKSGKAATKEVAEVADKGAAPDDSKAAKELDAALKKGEEYKRRFEEQRGATEEVSKNLIALRKLVYTKASGMTFNKDAMTDEAKKSRERGAAAVGDFFGAKLSDLALAAPQTKATLPEKVRQGLRDLIHAAAAENLAKPQAIRQGIDSVKSAFIKTIPADAVERYSISELFDTMYAEEVADLVQKEELRARRKAAKAKPVPLKPIAADALAGMKQQPEGAADQTIADMRARAEAARIAAEDAEAERNQRDYVAELKALQDKDTAAKTRDFRRELRSKVSEIIRSSDTDRTKMLDRMLVELGLPAHMAGEIMAKAQALMHEVTRKHGEQRLRAMVSQGKVPKDARTRAMMFDMLDRVTMGIMQGNEQWKQDARAAFAKKYGLATITPEMRVEMDALAEKVRNAKNETDRLAAVQDATYYIASKIGYSKAALGMSIVYSNLLGGPRTSLVNVSSNVWTAVEAMTNELEKALTESATTRSADPLRAYFNAITYSMYQGVRKGAAQAGRVIATGRQPYEFGKYDETPTSISALELYQPKTKAGKVLVGALRLPRRFLVAQDLLFRTPLTEIKTAIEYARVARESGLSGRALDREVAAVMGYCIHNDEFAQYLEQAKTEGYGTPVARTLRAWDIIEAKRADPDFAKTHPWLTADDVGRVRSDAERFGAENTYNQRPEGLIGNVTMKLGKAAQQDPLLKPLFMFTKIIANVSSRFLDHSGRGFYRAWTGKVRQLDGTIRNMSQDERNTHFWRAMNGLTFVGGLFALAMKHYRRWEEEKDKGDPKRQLPAWQITGAGPDDYGERKVLANSKEWQPHSFIVRFPNGKVYKASYANSPLAAFMASVGRYMDYLYYEKDDDLKQNKEEKALGEVAYLMARGSLKFVAQTSPLAYSSSMLTALQDSSEEQSAKSFQYVVAGMTRWAIPNFVTQLYQTSDGTKRKADTMGEAVIRNIPWAAGMLKPELNMLGEEIKFGPFGYFINEAEETPAWRLIFARNLSIPMPNPKLPDRDDKGRYGILMTPLTDAERYEWVKVYGPLMKSKIEGNIESLRKMSQPTLEAVFQRYHESAYAVAKKAIMQRRYDAYSAHKGLTSDAPAPQ